MLELSAMHGEAKIINLKRTLEQFEVSCAPHAKHPEKIVEPYRKRLERETTKIQTGMTDTEIDQRAHAESWRYFEKKGKA